MSFQAIPYAGGHHRITDIEGVAYSWPIHGQSFDSCGKASLINVWFYLDDNMIQAIQFEYLL
jgi:hypothetical protein